MDPGTTSSAALPSSTGGNETANLREVVNELKSIDRSLPPLEILKQQIEVVFSRGRLIASMLFMAVNECARKGETQIHVDKLVDKLHGNATLGPLFPWNSCQLAASLVHIFAARPGRRSMFEAAKFNSRKLQGLPTLQMIRSVPSASFDEAYKKAKEAALSPSGKTTVISVQLTDVHILELAEVGKSDAWTSFAHSFVVGIGPAGVIIWQSWGEHGYTLDEYLVHGGARIRTWEEAEHKFVTVFNKPITGEGTWNYNRNRWYKQCFEVDIKQVCGQDGPQRPIVPEFKTWVRLHVLEDVKPDDSASAIQCIVLLKPR